MQETQEMQVQSLGQKEPLENGMATHSGILAWRIPRTEEPGRLESMGPQRVGHNWEAVHVIWWEAPSCWGIFQNFPLNIHIKSLLPLCQYPVPYMDGYLKRNFEPSLKYRFLKCRKWFYKHAFKIIFPRISLNWLLKMATKQMLHNFSLYHIQG